jgi:iron complex outermembrane receptor protein
MRGRLLSILLLPLLATTSAWGQAPCKLVGRVADPSGAVVPGATVQAANAANNKVSRTTTDSKGEYVLDLVAGSYNITVKAPGLDTFSRENFVLNAGETARLEVQLRIRTVSQQITVTVESPTPVQAPYLVATSSQRLGESAARDVGEALGTVEGVTRIRKGGIANDVLMRGFQHENLNVLIDGIRVEGACPNQMDPAVSQVDLSQVKEVEILKGAFDVRNEGSLGGTVNIITRDAPKGFHVTPGISTGSFGYVNPTVSASLSKGKFSIVLGDSYSRSEPFRDGAGKLFTDYNNYRPESKTEDAFDIHNGWLKFGAALTKNQHMDISYSRQQGGVALYPYLAMDGDHDITDRLNGSYQISNLQGPLKQLRVEGYFTQVDHEMTNEFRLSSVGAPRPYSQATSAATRVYGVRVEAGISDFTFGFERYLRNWNAVNTMFMAGMYRDQTYIPDVNTSVAGLYGMYHKLLLNKLDLIAGVRLDAARSDPQSTTINSNLYWAYKNTTQLARTDVNPSANFRLAYTAREDLQLFVGVGSTVRLPDAEELYISLQRPGTDWVGNPNLEPTRNTEVDAGVAFQHGRFSFRPTLFYSRLTNFISLNNQAKVNSVASVANSSARSYENVEARMYGGELAFDLRLTSALVTSGGLSYTAGTKEPKPLYGIFNTNLAEMPPLKSRLALRYETRLFFTEIEGLAVDAQNRVDSDVQEQPTPGYGLLNLKLGVHRSRLNVESGIFNLLDRFYYESLSYLRDPFRSGIKVPEPGRNLFLRISYAF